MKNNTRRWSVLWLTIMLVTILTGCVNYSKDAEKKLVEGTLQVHYIDVGQGDSILLMQGEHSMLIDAGDNNCGTRVQSYLQANSIDTLDYVIGTHPDSDHIGGLDVIIYKFDCNQIWMPHYSKDTKTYEDVLMAVKEKNYKITSPVAGDNFMLGQAQVEVLSPGEDADYGEDANNYSIAVKVTYGEQSFLFTGDCEATAEEDMLERDIDLQADVMKAGHHGSDTSNTKDFLEAVNPKVCVISCGEENDYGHPRAEVLNNLRDLGVDVYRTDEQGTIVAVSDGSEVTWNTSPSQSWQSGEPTGNSQSTNESANIEATQTIYILNTNTKKIHKKNCDSVDEMNVNNRKETDKTIEELEAEGYSPCKRCKP